MVRTGERSNETMTESAGIEKTGKETKESPRDASRLAPALAASMMLSDVEALNSLNLYERSWRNRFLKSVWSKSGRRRRLSLERRLGCHSRAHRLTQRESGQPVLRLSDVGSQRLEHDTRVLSRDLLRRLSKVKRHVAGSLPEPKELRGKTVRNSQVVEGLRTTLRKTLKEWRHALRVSNADGLGEEVVVLEKEGQEGEDTSGRERLARTESDRDEPCSDARSGQTRPWGRPRADRRDWRARRCRTTRAPEELEHRNPSEGEKRRYVS